MGWFFACMQQICREVLLDSTLYKKTSGEKFSPLCLCFPRWFYIDIRLDESFDFTMLLFVCVDVLANQNENVTVHGASFIVSHIPQFFQHLLFNSDGYAFDCHKITSLRYIVCLFYGYYVIKCGI